MSSTKVSLALLTACAALVASADPSRAADCGGVTVCGCGDTVVSDYTLPADLDCTGQPGAAALIVAAAITLDGDDHVVTKLDGDGVHVNASGSAVTAITITTDTGAAIQVAAGVSATVTAADLSGSGQEGRGIHALAGSIVNASAIVAHDREVGVHAIAQTNASTFAGIDASGSATGLHFATSSQNLGLQTWTCDGCTVVGARFDNATGLVLGTPLGLSGDSGFTGVYFNGGDVTLKDLDLSGFALPGVAIGTSGATLTLIDVDLSGSARAGYGLQASTTRITASGLVAKDRLYGVSSNNTVTGSSLGHVDATGTFAGVDVSGSTTGLSFTGGGGTPNLTLTSWTATDCQTAAAFDYPSNLTLGHPVDLSGSVNGLYFNGGDVTLANLDFSAYGLTGTAVAVVGQPYYTFTLDDSNLSGSGTGVGLSVRQSLTRITNLVAGDRATGVDLFNTPPGSFLEGLDARGSATGIQLASNGGLRIEDAVLGGGVTGIAGNLGLDNVFRQVRVSDVTGNAVQTGGGVSLDHVIVDGASGCLLLGAPATVNVVSSTFHACATNALSVPSGATLNVDSSIVWPGGTVGGVGTLTITHTDLPAGAPGIGSNGNISADPLFTDAAAGDLTLGPDSPARDTGNPALGTPPSGYGPFYDMGAFEAAFIDDCPDDPDKTTPGVCGCGAPDLDADSDGAYECRYVVRMFDTSGVELSAASFSTEDGQSATSGGTLRFEQGATVRFRSTWKNANFWSAFFTVPSAETTVAVVRGDPPNAIGSVQTVSVAPGGGPRIDVVVDRGPLTITVVDATGVTLPSTDAFGNPVGAPSVTTDAPYLFSGPSGSSGEVAFGHVMRFNGRWMSAGLWPFITPLRATAFTVHGSEAGAPVTSAVAAEAAVIFEYDKITITVDAITPAGDPVPEATVGVEGFGFHPSPYRFEGPAGPPGSWWVRLNHSHTLHGARYPYIYLVKDAVLSLDGTNPESWISAGGQTVHIVYPPISVCGDGEIEGDEVCDDGNTADGDCCDASCTTAAAVGTACGSQASDACDDPDTCDGAGVCLANTETLDSDDDGVRDCEDACPLVHPATCASTFYVTVTTPTGLGQIACEVVGGEVSCARDGEVAVVVPVSQDTTCR